MFLLMGGWFGANLEEVEEEAIVQTETANGSFVSKAVIHRMWRFRPLSGAKPTFNL